MSSKVSSQNQITLPSRVRKILGIKPGDKVVFVEEEDRIVIRNLHDLADEVLECLKDIAETEEEFRKGFQFREIPDGDMS